MRRLLVACFLLLIAAAVAPPTCAMCVPRKPGAAGKVVSPTKPTPTPPPKATPVAPGGDIIKAMCAKTDDPKFCQASIAKQPPLSGGKKLDDAGVLQLAMNAVKAKAVEAKKAATALIADPKTPKAAVSALNDCAGMYDDIPSNLDHAKEAIASGDKHETASLLSACIADVSTCEQDFEESEEKPLMAKQDAELIKLVGNCIAINGFKN